MRKSMCKYFQSNIKIFRMVSKAFRNWIYRTSFLGLDNHLCILAFSDWCFLCGGILFHSFIHICSVILTGLISYHIHSWKNTDHPKKVLFSANIIFKSITVILETIVCLFSSDGGKSWHVFYHFVGAVPGSTYLEPMLKRLLRETQVAKVV